MKYALYKDSNEEYTLITQDGGVYSFDEYDNIMKLDSELNMNVPYKHLGKEVSIDAIKKRSAREFVKTLISI